MAPVLQEGGCGFLSPAVKPQAQILSSDCTFQQHLCSCFADGIAYFYGSGVCNQFQKYEQYSVSPQKEDVYFQKELKKKHFKSNINCIIAVEDRHTKALFCHWVKQKNEESKFLCPVSAFSTTSIWRQTSASCRKGRAVLWL